MIGKGRIITHDLYDIADRIKEIDEDYFIVRDYRTGKFQIHNSRQKGGTLALVLPFDRLDYRTIVSVRRTRAERKNKLLEEMERDNRKLLERQLSDATEKIKRSL